jgi:pimeloyl-ACP methyl ester carboxylesterase
MGNSAAGKDHAMTLRSAAAKTFVLVHGAWRGGWIWREVADLLTARGHKVYTPTLSGVADRCHLLGPAIDLSTHITDVANLIKWEALKDIVLCGHSYAGMVISGAAELAPRAISSIVFLDAFLPEDSKSLFDYLNQERRALTLALIERGEIAQEPPPAAYFGVSEKKRAWVDSQCTPHPVRCFMEKVALTGARERIPKKTYIFASGWESHFRPFYEKAKADPSWRTDDIPSSHDVMVDSPERLAEILEESA